MRSKLNNQDEVRLFVTSCDHDTSLVYLSSHFTLAVVLPAAIHRFTIVQVNEESFELAYSSNLIYFNGMWQRIHRNHSYSLSKHSALVSRVDTLPRAREVLSRHLQHELFDITIYYYILLNGVIRLYSHLYCMLYPSSTACVQSFHRTSQNMTIVGRRRCKAGRTCSACATGVISNVSNT